MNYSTPGFPVHHQLPEYDQTLPSSQWYHPTISSSIVPFSSCLQSFPASWSFPMSQFFCDGQSIGASASASVLSMNSQDWLPFGLPGTLKSVLQHHNSKPTFFSTQLMTSGKTIELTRRTFVCKVMSLLFNMLSRFVIAFLPWSKCLLISWLQSPSVVTLEP